MVAYNGDDIVAAAKLSDPDPTMTNLAITHGGSQSARSPSETAVATIVAPDRFFLMKMEAHGSSLQRSQEMKQKPVVVTTAEGDKATFALADIISATCDTIGISKAGRIRLPNVHISVKIINVVSKTVHVVCTATTVNGAKSGVQNALRQLKEQDVDKDSDVKSDEKDGTKKFIGIVRTVLEYAAAALGVVTLFSASVPLAITVAALGLGAFAMKAFGLEEDGPRALPLLLEELEADLAVLEGSDATPESHQHHVRRRYHHDF
jgi:hypothetical protein